MKTVLTIAGSDCSGGAGIQADLKTVAALGLYGMSVITALTAQNTTGVYGIMDASPEFVEQQLDCVFEDIPPDAVKIGMVSNPDIIRAIARKLRQYNSKAIVTDPVMVSTSGSRLLRPEAEQALVEELFPGAVVTPNLFEAQVLAEMEIRTKEDMLTAARKIMQTGCKAVLLKGGHLGGTADDLLYCGNDFHWFTAERVNNPNTHGTGCTLSSAIACGLALGKPLEQAVEEAKQYLTGALKAGLDLGRGSGPLMHNYRSVKEEQA